MTSVQSRRGPLVLKVSDVRHCLWFAVATTMPLFAVEWWRVHVVGYVAIPMMLLFAILAFETIASLAGLSAPNHGKSSVRLVLPWCGALLMSHLLATFSANDTRFAVAEISKLVTGLVLLVAISWRFPRELRFVSRFWIVAIWSSAVMFGFLIYKYGFVFRAGYLSSDIGDATKAAKNQLAWYLNILIPFAVACVVAARQKILIIPPLLVLLVAWIYIMSRSTWICVTLAVAAMILGATRVSNFRHMTLRFVLALATGVILTAAAWNWLSSFLPSNDAAKRLLSIYAPNEVPELHSYENRGWRISQNLSRAVDSPVFGIGLTNVKTGPTGYAHNDYVGILTETGIVGLGFFICVLATIAYCIRIDRMRSMALMPWLSLGYRGAFVAIVVSMAFVDTYTTPSWWMFMGMALAWADTEGRGRPTPAELPTRAVH